MQIKYRYALMMILVGNAGCTPKKAAQGPNAGSNLADISLGGVSVDTLPWNESYKAKDKAAKEALLKSLGFGFQIKLKASDTKCASDGVEKLVVGSFVVPRQMVTRGCTYDITLSFGSTLDPEKPSDTNVEPKAFLKTLLAGATPAKSYTVPEGAERPDVPLRLCPTQDAAAYFDTSICTALEPDSDKGADAAKTYAVVRLFLVNKNIQPPKPCSISSCEVLDRDAAQAAFDQKSLSDACAKTSYFVPSGDCKDYPTGSGVTALEEAVTAGKAYKSGTETKLP